MGIYCYLLVKLLNKKRGFNMSKYLKSNTLLDKLSFPECPRWHKNKLWFSNIFANQLIIMEENGTIDKILDIPSIGIDFLSDDSLIYVELSHENQRIMRYKDGKSTVYCSNINSLFQFVFNDLVISSKNICYTGNTGCNASKPEDWNIPSKAPIASIDVNGKAKICAKDLIGPNGMIITPDEKTLIVAEPNAHRLTSFDLNDDGTLTNRKVFAQLEDKHKPDGICIDEEGAIWTAAGTECIRVLKGGKITHRIETIGSTSLACMLGGFDRQTLYICTKNFNGYSADDFVKSKSGRIEIIKPDTPPGAGKP